MTPAFLNRYQTLLGDEWPAFTQSLDEPLPQCVSVNHQRVDGARLHEILGQVDAEPVDWAGEALRLPPDARPGLHWAYRAGLYTIHEEASLLPVSLLAPARGLSVLDLCAAPGGKSARIALALGNRGTLIANDAREDRLAAIGDAVRRLGLLNVTITCHDGAIYPARDGLFDRVLVDAPCSSEGTVRKLAERDRLRPPRTDFRRWASGVQRALLRRAVALTRPGGRIVYSTCTFAPEENEAVVSDVLEMFGDALRVLEVPLPGLDSAAGLAHWDGRTFHPDLRHAHRLWPQRSGTGGFFAVALQRLNGSDCHEIPRAPGDALDIDITPWRRRFGLSPECFEDLRFHRAGRYVRAVAADHVPPRRVRMVTSGIAFERHGVRHRKLSTTAAMLHGAAATRNVVEIDAATLADYRARRAVPLAASALACCDGPGHVLVRHHGFGIGIGQLAYAGDTPMLASLYPKDWSRSPG